MQEEYWFVRTKEVTMSESFKNQQLKWKNHGNTEKNFVLTHKRRTNIVFIGQSLLRDIFKHFVPQVC